MALVRLEADDTLCERTRLSVTSLKELLIFCAKSNYFKCDGEFYRMSTCPIGSPLSPCLASIFMEVFEERVLSDAPVRVRMWRRYVDDCWAVVRRGDEDKLLRHLNEGHSNISFTHEIEEGGVLNFLDVEIRRDGESDGVRTTVFRKKVGYGEVSRFFLSAQQ